MVGGGRGGSGGGAARPARARKRPGPGEPRLLPAGVTPLPGAAAGAPGGEVLHAPAAFPPAEAQQLLEQLQVGPAPTARGRSFAHACSHTGCRVSHRPSPCAVARCCFPANSSACRCVAGA